MTIHSRTDAIYARQSIDKADSISIESQIELCSYETRGAPFLTFADRGYSGKNTDRPEFQKMLRQIRSGLIRRVICYKLDRCSRSILDFTALMEEFRKYGVEFVSCTEKFDTSTPVGRAMLNICIVFAQLERETIQQRVCDAYHSRSQKGFYMGGKVPFGFRREPYVLEGKRTSRYVREEKEAQILTLLYEAYAEPECSLGDLVALLRKKGIVNPRRSDGRWVRSHIGRMLANPVYVKADISVHRYYQKKGAAICNDPRDFIGINGCYLYSGKDGRQCLVLAPHEGLVPSGLWLKCRSKGTDTPSKAPGQPVSWLTGKLRCAQCGHHLVITGTRGKNGRQYRYIRCSYAHGQDRCCSGLRGWKAETAEQVISSVLTKHLTEHYPVLADPKTSAAEENTGVEIRIAQLRCEIEKAAAKALETSGALLAQLNTHVQQLERQKEALVRQRCQRNEPREVVQPDYIRLWEALPSERKRIVLDALVSSITLSESTLTVTWN